MTYTSGREGSDGCIEMLRTHSRLVAMNAAAAGHARKTRIWHARHGNGLTLSVDIALSGDATIQGGEEEAAARRDLCRMFKTQSKKPDSVLKTGGRYVIIDGVTSQKCHYCSVPLKRNDAVRIPDSPAFCCKQCYRKNLWSPQ